MPRIAILFTLSLLTLLVVSPGVAKGAAPEDAEATRAQAAAHYHEGRLLFDQELYEAAIQRFRQAQELMPAPANLYNIAKSYERLGASSLCVDAFDSYLRAYKDLHGRPAPDAVDVRNSMDKCRLGARIPLSIESDPPGASIYLDDMTKLLGQTPYATTTDPGTYRLRLTLDGHVPFDRTLEVRAGEPLKVVFKLEKHRAIGTLAVRANVSGASIYVDGRNVGLTPFPDAIELDAGSHQVTVDKDDYSAYSTRVMIAAEEQTQVEATIFLTNAPSTWKGYLGYTTLGLGAAALGGGYFLGAHADTFFAGSPEFDEYAGYQKMAYGSGAGLAVLGIVLAVVEALDDRAIKPGDAITHRPHAPWAERFARGGHP
jgi:tetratricopeptide (TPR) repeat protein